MELVTDDIVPLLIMTITQSTLSDLLSTVTYIMEFDFTQLNEGELGFGLLQSLDRRFCFSSFHVATNFLLEKAKEWNHPSFVSSSITPRTIIKTLSTQSSLFPPSRLPRTSQKDLPPTRKVNVVFNPTQQVYRDEQGVTSCMEMEGK